jgi:hypothetical protein
MSDWPWLDMEFHEFTGTDLHIICGIDTTVGHSLEIIFEDVFHMTLNSSWMTETSKPVIILSQGEELQHINLKYGIEQGYLLFKILSEDVKSPFFVAARSIRFDTTRVYYYKRENLADNERIADWVT